MGRDNEKKKKKRSLQLFYNRINIIICVAVANHRSQSTTFYLVLKFSRGDIIMSEIE